ncbi:MAG: SMP-30/gluconolactonase/LRE family protein [Isosphaeraceae bacterium]
MSTALIIASALVAFQAPPDAAKSQHHESVIAPGAKLEKVFGDGEFTEGGAMDADGSILFSDIGNRILRYDPKTGKTTVFREPSGRANGLIFDPQGRLIAAEGANVGGGRRVSITERDGTIRTMSDGYAGRRFNSPNDVAVDSDGQVYVSDPRYVGDEPRDLDFEGIFLISLDGFTIPMNVDVSKPNGLAISPDGKLLYIADNGPKRRALIVARIGDRGKLYDSKVLYDFGKARGIDGMTVTTDGRIVAATGAGDKAGAYVFSPQGKLLETIPTPEDPANVEFGGDDGKTLYICAGRSLYRIKTTMTGFRQWPRKQ